MSRAMKDSGIPWIGEIPESWKIVPFKTTYRLAKGLTITKADLIENGVPVISYGQIHSKSNTGTNIIDSLIRYVPESFILDNSNSLVCKGDIIFADTSEDLEGCGNCIYTDREMVLFAGYHTIIAKNTFGLSSKYIAYLFKTDCWRYQLRTSVNGVKLFSISQKILANTSVILPSQIEQQQIADYLDTKCAEVDELIALQERMIDELKVYKQSVITEAVTKGLNHDAPLKNSGIEWIGQIPEHWRMKKLKNILRTSLQYGANESGIPYNDNLPRYVRITDITDNTLKEDIDKQSLTEKQAKGYILEDKDILFARSGATVGKSFMYNQHYGICAFAGYLIKASIDIYNNPKFIHYYTLTHSYEEWKKQIFIQATIQNIGADRYAQLTLPIPSIEEQQQIAEYLDKKCAEVDEMTSIKQQKIEQLKEYKKSIIYEYVTGKKQVNIE